jgi:hypothetical protein
MAQTLPYVPAPVAVYMSTTGAKGTWVPATTTGGTALPYTPSPVGVYCSPDALTWSPCSAFTAGATTLVKIPSPSGLYVSTTGAKNSWEPVAGVNGTALVHPPPPLAAYCSSDGTGNVNTWAPCALTAGSAVAGIKPTPVGLYCSTDGTGHSGTWAPCATSFSLPNFGNSTDDPSSNVVGSFLAGSYFTAPVTGTYTTFHIFCSSGTGTSYFGVYPAPGGNASGQTLIAQGTYQCAAGGGLVSGSISVPVTAGTEYFFAAQTSAATFAIAWNSATGNAAFAAGAGAPLPTTAPTLTNQTGNYLMYLSKP